MILYKKSFKPKTNNNDNKNPDSSTINVILRIF